MRTLLLLALVLGCKDKDSDDSGKTVPVACDVDISFNEIVQTAATFTWTSDQAGTARIEYGLQGATDQTLTSTESGTDHALTAIALAHGGTYTWRAVVDTGNGEEVLCDGEEFKVSQAPVAIPKFTINISEPESEVANGYVLLSTLGADSSWVGLLSGTGKYHFTAGADADNLTIARAKMSRDGQSVIYNYAHGERIDDLGGLARVSFDGLVSTRTRTLTGHHDFVELQDGSFGWLGYDYRNIAMPVEGAPDTYAERCPGGICPTVADSLYEGPEGMVEADTPKELMNFFDDYDTDPWWTCSHSSDYGGFLPDNYEWTHGNSLGYVDSQDMYYMMPRYLDNLVKIDRNGVVQWTLGGPDSDFTLTSGDWFDHGHFSEVWEDGFMLFDNGDHRGYSRVAEYSWDEANRTAELVWSLDHPENQMLPILGDIVRLPGGNRLISWSADAIIQEVTTDGTVVWEAQAGGFGIVSRVTFVAELPK